MKKILVILIMFISMSCKLERNPFVVEEKDEFTIFVIFNGSNYDIYRINLDGSELINLTNGYGNNTQPNLSPSQNNIIFMSNREDRIYNIYSMEVNGTNIKKLSEEHDYVSYPIYFTQGNKIAYRYRPNFIGRISIMDINGANKKEITDTTYDCWAHSVSPDGKKITFTANKFPLGIDIYLQNIDGSNFERITSEPGADSDSKFSPNGSKIAYTSANIGNPRSLFIMNSDGSNKQKLTDCSYETNFTFSSDGEFIIFTEFDSRSNYDIYRINTDGSNLINLTNSETAEFDIKLSSNNKHIIYRSWINHIHSLYMMDLDGNNKIKIYETEYEIRFE